MREIDGGRPALRGSALTLLLTVLFAALASPAAAQRLGRVRGLERQQFEEHFFPPELVMSHQGEIGLSEDQRQALVAELQRTQADLVPLQIEISAAGERFQELLAPSRVDEGALLAEAERVMQLEAEIKRRHLMLVVRIKNLLTGEQQARLRAIRAGRG